MLAIFQKRQYGSSIVTSKVTQKSQLRKHKIPKQTIFLETPVFMLSLLRIFDGFFDVITDHPFLT